MQTASNTLRNSWSASTKTHRSSFPFNWFSQHISTYVPSVHRLVIPKGCDSWRSICATIFIYWFINFTVIKIIVLAQVLNWPGSFREKLASYCSLRYATHRFFSPFISYRWWNRAKRPQASILRPSNGALWLWTANRPTRASLQSKRQYSSTN